MLRSISEYLRKSVELYPEHIAVTDGKKTVSYETMFRDAITISTFLIKKELFKCPIAIYMDKGIWAIESFFGAAMSGNFYTVVDTKMPENRVGLILDTFLPKIILTDEKNIIKAKKFEKEDCVVVDIKDVLNEWDDKGKDEKLVSDVERRIIDMDLLYVLFTSGSTGTPKGVMITHRSVIDYIEWASETFLFNHESVFGNQAPLYFDNSVLDIYCSVRNGGTLHLIPQVAFSFPIRLLEYIRDKKINTVFWVPTVLSRIADLNILDKCDISCLNKIIFAGEVMPARQLNIWMKRLPSAVFANLYGPTEVTVDCTYYIVDRKIEDDESVPIGFPCANTDILVLNKDNKLVENGEKGELCVRGSSLSLGYYRNSDKTDAAFVQNPINTSYRELIYRTGDIVHYNDRGEIIFDGRADTQVKHTGHRIELGEIETAVSSDERVEMNCCLHKVMGDKLVLFYSGGVSEKEIRQFLIERLPEYMIPNIYIKMNSLPLNMNGKIDRVKLNKKIKEL